MDLFYFGTVFNLIWNMFTILFVLYRFTSFFTYMFGFIRFCGRIASSTKYYFNRFVNRSSAGYVRLPDDVESEEPLITNAFTDNPTSIWARMKSGYNTVTNFIWSNNSNSNVIRVSTIPVYVQPEVSIPMNSRIRPQTHPDINTKSKEYASVTLDNPFDSYNPQLNSTSQVLNDNTPTFYSNFINDHIKNVVLPFANAGPIQTQPFHESSDSNSSV